MNARHPTKIIISENYFIYTEKSYTPGKIPVLIIITGEYQFSWV